MKDKWFVFGVLILMLLGLSACLPRVEGPRIIIKDAWGRSSPMVAASGAFYMEIANSGSEDDTLISATSPACGRIELHESFMKDDGTMGMQMVEGGRIDIPAGESVELKVGGLHVMCLQKQQEFKAGDNYPLTLTFEKSGDILVVAVIKDE
jgi:copper(I)-binding protein